MGPNQATAVLRCGMGPCQGRLCGLTLTETLADAHGRGPAEIGPLRVRSPVKPVTLADAKANPRLAGMSLVTSFRLSVQPVTAAEWKEVCRMGGLKA